MDGNIYMQKLLLIHGANLNMLGKRNPDVYGLLTLKDIEKLTASEAKKYRFQVIAFQSNHEGDLIDKLQVDSPHCVGIIINPGAFSHYSLALHDALLDTKLPVVEVHLSNVKQREIWRRKSVTAPACIEVISGKKEEGYRKAVKVLAEHLNAN
jgi:3-dehydroquinate dehydratase II